MTRPTFDEIRLAQLDKLGERSTCDRGHVACILTLDDRVLSEGYAGSPPGLPHCDDVGHLMEWRTPNDPCSSDTDLANIGLVRQHVEEEGYYPSETETNKDQVAWDVDEFTRHCTRTVHAEANAIAWAARRGIAVEGAAAYVSMTPCRDCAKLLITAGIKKIVVKKDYHASEQSKEMFLLAGVELVIVGEL